MNLSDTFPILNEYIYLNTANSGILSKNLMEWRVAHDADFMASGSIFRLQQPIITGELRENLTALFTAEKANTFLVQNFSTGFNSLLNGLQKSHRVLLLNEDYPSVNYPVKSSGFEFLEVPIDEDLEDKVWEAIKHFKPSIFAFSVVQYISGIRIDPEFIKKLKDCHPDMLLIADGTQFCGTAQVHFKTSGLDALVASGYKWMLGGYGNGFIFLSDQIKSMLYQDKKTAYLPEEPFLKGKDRLSLCLEPGHLDTLNFGSLNQSVRYLQSLGLENIERTNQLLSQKAREAFLSRGLLSEAMLNRPVHSTIMSLPLEQKTLKKLDSAKIICSARGSGTRFSFHFYNTENDLDRLLSVLDEI